jgi:hypothetical protein
VYDEFVFCIVTLGAVPLHIESADTSAVNIAGNTTGSVTFIPDNVCTHSLASFTFTE